MVAPKKRILIVDDELVSRKKIQIIMDSFGEIHEAQNGNEALTSFSKAHKNGAPFDLIFLDISMPDIDGTKVLHKIREIEEDFDIPEAQRVKIIMVSAHSDKGSILDSIQGGCDDYVTKPFKRTTINKKLKKLGLGCKQDKGTASPPPEVNLIDALTKCYHNEKMNLPSLPKIGFKFYELYAKGASHQEVVDLLQQDLAISFKLIAISNSSFYPNVVEIKTLEHAVSRIGLRTTKQIVDTICNHTLYRSSNKKYVPIIQKLWLHSLSCAFAAETAREILKIKNVDDSFTMGMLHDIGKLGLIKMIIELESNGKFSKEISESELFQALDQLHTDFGCLLMQRWGYSNDYVELVKFHNNLEKADPVSIELLLVHFANLLVKSMGYGLGPHGEIDLAGAESTRFLGLNDRMITAIEEQIKKHIEKLNQLIA